MITAIERGFRVAMGDEADDIVRRGADLGYANLTGANLDGVRWINTTCPDGTNSDDNGNTCENNL